jgi:uncharacterized membrane protein YdjX (TVP38/TMEM64 family)
VRSAGDSIWVRAAALGVLLALGVVIAFTVDLPGVGAVRGWVDGAGAGVWAAMVLGLALVLLAPIPRSAVSVLIGVVAGFGPGLAVALAGSVLSGLGAFGLARALGRPAVSRLAGRKLGRVDELMVDHGFGALLVARLIPALPHFLVSYGAGLTAARVVPYALSTAIGIVPGTVVQVGIGASAGVLATWTTPLTVVPAVVAGLLVSGVAGLAWRRRRSARDDGPVPAA